MKKLIGLYKIGEITSQEIYKDVIKKLTPVAEEKEWEVAFIPTRQVKDQNKKQNSP